MGVEEMVLGIILPVQLFTRQGSATLKLFLKVNKYFFGLHQVGSVYPGFIVVQCWVKFLLSLAFYLWRRGEGVFHSIPCHAIVVANCKELTNFEMKRQALLL